MEVPPYAGRLLALSRSPQPKLGRDAIGLRHRNFGEVKIRCLLTGLALGAVLVITSSAAGGGPFEQIVGVGAGGAWRAIDLRPRGPRSEDVLYGPRVRVPHGGFVRIYPTIGGLPGDPGRYYPASQVVCLYWREPASNCMRLRSAGIALLSPFAKLPLRHLAPTTPVEVRYASRVLRYANGNILAAIELALERRGEKRASAPPHAIRLAVRWSGPLAARMPAVLDLAPSGVYASKRYFGLSRGPWCYLAANLPHASAGLIEATGRICG